jgi:hypothetical protein
MGQASTLCEQHIRPRVVEQASALGRKRPPLEKIKIQLWRNSAGRNWSIRVNDERYDAVTVAFVQRLVTRRLSDAKTSLLEEGRRPN